MFYSQFILAKKGPLGTIWIAAHLERKLRKNQVADTDIGVSVDSIIFPDVPIALRLSSHLLLGVVRIYSRKVNYLFDDCSETLLKVKQAFRSTAVDLPPEESTAPYHSITLPETFDLDDFELPDQGIFQGNYVDNHISNKEQITLQDTMDGVVFSTSQFELDERFGDGDTSQIGLDLDEDRLLNKQPSPENVRDEIDLDHGHHTSGHLAESIINENNEEVTESAKLMEAEPRGLESVAISHNISAPATPGLVEESNLSNQKASASDDIFESEKHLLETGTYENPSGTLHSSPRGDDIMVNHDSGHKIKQSIANLENSDVTPGEVSDLKTSSDHPCSNTADLTEKSSSLLSNGYQLDGHEIIHPDTLNGITVPSQVEEPSSPTNQLALNELVSESVQVLQSCSSDMRVNDNLSNCNVDTSLDFDKSCDMQADVTKFQELQPSILSESLKVADNAPESVNEMNQSADACQLIQPNDTGLSNKTESSITTNPANFDSSPRSELPAREKLLSIPELHAELSPDLLLDTTPAKVLSATDEDRSGVTTGQKRSFAESSLTMDSMHTAESSGNNRLGKTAEAIPDDEDLLSSILVGRRSSLLKLKPTPTQTEVVPMKRPRIASRNITYKRKVLMDDVMVLHGDTIREQLMSTEDIRRVRKKAPCTHQEIWMIQKQYLEEDIVYDPISTGMSMELVCLHNQAYELSGITVTKVDDPMVPTESACDMQPPVDNVAIPNSCGDVIEELNFESQPRTISLQTEKQPAEGDTSLLVHGNIELNKGVSTASLSLPTYLEQGVISEMEVDGEGVSVVEAAEHASSFPVDSLSPTCGIPADNVETTACAVTLAGETNDCSKVDNEASLLDHSNKDVYLNVDAANDGIGSLFHTDSETRNKLSSKEAEDVELIKNIELPHTAPETHDYEIMDNNGNIEDCPHPVDHDVNMEMSPIGGQNEIPHEFHEFHESPRQPNGTTGACIAVVTEDYNGMHYMTADHDTGFLNVDDDDLEVDESYAPSVEETRKRIVDESGWSSRSRAVGKYLQIMFDKEAEHGKNVIPVGNLLAGKSRKEASRMFFETLVLKTRDYIDVEQTSPFNNINLRPRSVLLKSDF